MNHESGTDDLVPAPRLARWSDSAPKQLARFVSARNEVRHTTKNQSVRLHRILEYLNANLQDPDLTPNAIAAAHGISTRYLSKLFECQGVSVTRYILDRRLDRCRTELEDACSAHKQITEIAFYWGFSSASHFSRTFKERYGMTPTQARMNARSFTRAGYRSLIAR